MNIAEILSLVLSGGAALFVFYYLLLEIIGFIKMRRRRNNSRGVFVIPDEFLEYSNKRFVRVGHNWKKEGF